MRVPDPLRPYAAFLIWRLEANQTPGKKPLKVPMHYDGITRHSTANPAPLLTADQAEQWLAYLRGIGVGHGRAGEPGYVGIGFRPNPSNGIVVVDLDDTLDNPAIVPFFGGAGMEVSHSGNGLHLWCFSRNAATIGRRGRANTAVGAIEVYADNQFIALGTWLGGDPLTDCTEMLDLVLTTYFAPLRAREVVTAADWDAKTDAERAAALVDLTAALGFYDPDSRDEWVSAGQALKCLGDLGRDLWAAWSATSSRFPGGSDLEKWDSFTGDRSDYRAIFARAQTRGWVNMGTRLLPDTVFTPTAMPEGASHQPTAAAVDALNVAVAAIRATPTAEGVREAAFTVARMAAGGQIPWQEAREALALAAPDVDVQVLDSAHAVAKFTPLTAPAQAVIEAEQIQVSSKVGWLREQGLVGADAVLNERAMAFRVQEAHPGQMRRLSTSEEWIRWTDSRWVRWQHAQVRDLCMHEVPVMLAREMVSLAGVNAAEYAKAAAKAATTATAGNVASTLAFLPGVLIEPGQIDADPMLLGMNGGRQVLDLTTGRVRAAELGDYVTRNLGPTSIGDARQAVRWTRFLHEVFEGDTQLVDWMHRFCGYMLTGKTTEHIFLFLFGHGSNGKSVFTKALEGLMGEYGRSLQPTSLCDDKRAAGGATADLASLDGMRLVVSPEAEEGSRFAESLLKGLVGGDKMPVRQLYAKPYDMVPVLKLVLTGNHKPTIRGTDDGVWRRVRLVPFKANFQGREDRGLSDALANEMPHILAWAIEGCLRWQRQGLSDVPTSIQQATSEYRDEMDVLGAWLGDECEQGGQEDVTLLYANYKSWCERGGLRQIWTARVFSQKLNEYGRRGWRIDNGRTKHARIKHGLHLKNSVFLAGPK